MAGAVPVTREPWPKGAREQDEKTILNMARYTAVGSRSPGIRTRMAQALDAAGIPRSARPSVLEMAAAARAWVKENVRYASDGILAEIIQDPRITSCAEDAPGGACIPMEDCDGHTVLVLAMLASVGVEVRIVSITYGPGVQPHVKGAARDESKRWLRIDTTTEDEVGHARRAGTERLIDPFDPKIAPPGIAGGEYIGVGKAPSYVPESPTYLDALYGRGLGAGTILGMHTVHEVVDLTNAWDYQVSRIDYAVNCARVAGWAPNYGTGEQDAASAWLDQWNDATATYLVARTDSQTLFKTTIEGGNANGYSWDTDGAYVANAQGQSVDVWAEILNAVAPFADLDRQLRMRGNPTGFPKQCLPTYPHVPQPTAPDWDLNVYKAITRIPGFEPGAPWYKPLVIAGIVVGASAAVVATVYTVGKVADITRMSRAGEPKLRTKRKRARLAA